MCTATHCLVLLIFVAVSLPRPHQDGCANVVPSKLSRQCSPSVGYQVSSSLNYADAANDATIYYSELVDAVRKATNRKQEHCVEALNSLACFLAFDKCVSQTDLQPPCRAVCELAASFCNVSSSILQCQTYQSVQCFEEPLLHGLPCAVPNSTDLQFCTMVAYNTSRTYHGPNFQVVDNAAKQAYNLGSSKLPSGTCKVFYKYQICQNYFRHCDLIGNSLLPCNTMCLALNSEACTEFPLDCLGPEYGTPDACYSLPLPNITIKCTVTPRYSGLDFCNMIDYPIDASTIIPVQDSVAKDLYTNIISTLKNLNRTITTECQDRLRDFSCASLFVGCNSTTSTSTEDGITSTKQVCQSFCDDVVNTCGGFVPGGGGGCDGFKDSECITIYPSSRQTCLNSFQCATGEYCYLYGVSGVCLKQTNSTLLFI